MILGLEWTKSHKCTMMDGWMNGWMVDGQKNLFHPVPGFQWMVCWWWLLVFTQFARQLNFKPASFSKQREVGPWIHHGPEAMPKKLAYQGTKKMHEFAHGKVLCLFSFEKCCWTRSLWFAFMSSLWWSFLPQFRGVILWGREKEKEREDQMIPIMHVGCNSNFSCGLDH